MRRLIAALAAVGLALGLTLVAAGSAGAAITSPSNGSVLAGTVTVTDSGGNDSSWLNACSGIGRRPNVQMHLVNSGGTTVASSTFKDGEGDHSWQLNTRNHPNGSYQLRSIGRNVGGWNCSYSNFNTGINVTIRNTVNLTSSLPSNAPQNTSVPVSATVTDQSGGAAIGGLTVNFAITGGGSVSATTNGAGVATASLPVAGPPRGATISATFPGTAFWQTKSVSAAFQVTKNSTATTLAQPAPVVHGQATSFSATVAPTNGTGVPGGTIQFTVDGNNFGSPVTLVGGAASSQSTSTLSTEDHAVGAVYSGDGNFVGSIAATKTQVVDKAATTTQLTSDISPSVSGQPVTFTAEVDVVAPGAGTPTGGVQFNVDGQPFGTAVPLIGGTASLTIANLSTDDNHAIDATYNGNGDFAVSSSAELTHGVNKAEAAVDLSTSQVNAVAGEPLTFTADVTAVGPGAGTPTGSVQFAVDGVDLGAPVTLSGGTATSPTANLDAGPHVVSVDYTGDDNFGGAQDYLTLDVAAAQTTTALTSSPNPSVVGQPVTFRAEVTAVAPATGTPAGAVQFFVDGSAAGLFVQLDGGVAELTLDTLGVGSHDVTAKYLSGTANFITSTSDPVTQQVNRAATSVDVTSSSAPSVYGQPVTFTATVSVQAPGAGSPSGTITFMDGAVELGTVPVNSGTGFQGSITTSSLSVAQHAIVATYSGDDSFHGSTDTVVQKVNRAQTSTLVTSSVNPAQSGEPVTFTAEVSPVAPGAGDPTGTVSFTVNGANLGGPATVVNGVATSTSFASLSPGSYVVKATYSGDGNFVTSTGSLDQGTGQGVVKGQTEMTLESDDPSSEPGQPVTFTSTVMAVAPAAGRPSGVVQVWEGSVLLGASSLTPAGPNTAQATFVTSTLTPGAHAIRAVYVGNFNFEGQTASTSQSVGLVDTVTGVTSSPNPSTFGDDVTLTAVVTPTAAAPGVPTGTVTFTEGGDVLGTATLSSVQGQRQASITLDSLSGGTHAITATYSGDASYGGSASAAYTQVVERAASTLVLDDVIERIGDNGGRVRATLTGNNGDPIAGETVSFTTSQNIGTAVNRICSGITDADGFVDCHNTNLMPAVIVNGGYDGHFLGNGDYLPADDHAAYTG